MENDDLVHKDGDLVLYETHRDIKISRFFEVAEYLTKENLWGEVEKLLTENQLIGSRIILDKNLGNAVKIVVERHSKSIGTFETDDLPKQVVLCAHRPCANCGGRGY
ncbi:TPA: hypothetical protein RRI78_004856 [Klebsiella pneumoniae]|nr:hypothetical protein [Klebsiella pneumoniae]